MAKPKTQKGAKRPAARPQQNPTSRGTAERGTQSAKQRAFVAEYLKDLNGTQAAIRAGYSPDSARFIASELLAKPEIAAEVEAAMKARAERNAVDADAVLRRFKDIATADPSELMEIQRVCCRYCYGAGHLYQRTPREMREARENWNADQAAAKKEDPKHRIVPFDEAGGVGYDPRKTPHPNCPECWGEGEQRVVLKDIRDVSPQARLLFAGVKQTQHGIEIKVHDQVGALKSVGEHMGLFKQKIEHTGKDGGAIELKQLLDEIDGADTGL